MIVQHHTGITTLLASLPLLALACDRPAEPTTSPAAPPPAAEQEAEPAKEAAEGDAAMKEEKPEPEAPEKKVPEDAISIGTFNLDWALDDLEDDRTKQGKQRQAKTSDDWDWKRDKLVDVLVAENLDIVAVQEVGSERELSELAVAIREKKGPDYDYSFVESQDKYSGLHVGVLSRFEMSDERRLKADIRKQMAVKVALPDGSDVTLVVMHAREGTYQAHAATRRKQARSMKAQMNRIQGKGPLIALGTLSSERLPADDAYKKDSSVGILAGKHNYNKEDDCMDSAEFGSARETTVSGKPHDRILACGIEMRGAEVTGRDMIVNKDPDPDKAEWNETPADKAPFRDASDHLVLWAEIALPKGAPKKQEEEE